jgi:hypothetical protein
VPSAWRMPFANTVSFADPMVTDLRSRHIDATKSCETEQVNPAREGVRQVDWVGALSLSLSLSLSISLFLYLRARNYLCLHRKGSGPLGFVTPGRVMPGAVRMEGVVCEYGFAGPDLGLGLGCRVRD